MVLRYNIFKRNGLLIVNILYVKIKERNKRKNKERLRKARKKLD
jgi:hypothetical protein